MAAIDRKALVKCHNPVFTEWDPRSPLSVGNGDFAFTADCTGLQSFDETLPGTVPLCTMSQRGFHSYRGTPGNYSDLKLREYRCGKRTVGYMTDSRGQEELFDNLRQNPHRFHLGRIGLELNDRKLSGIRQKLDLWTGRLSSRFLLGGKTVNVTTVCHPRFPMISVRLKSPLLSSGELPLVVKFPYGSHEMCGADWNRDEAHKSVLTGISPRNFIINRQMDDCRYRVVLRFSSETDISCDRKGPHRWIFSGRGDVLEFSILYSLDDEDLTELPDYPQTVRVSSDYWRDFWNKGAAVSFEGSTDPRAFELERRVILSQYLLAIQSMGSLPPAETGLTCNSWYGKFHLEMHPWHSLQGLLWNRKKLVEKSLSWYGSIMECSRERAEKQGYKGVRWPKMTDSSGNDSPSPIGCLLCWQQRHIILFAEMLYRLNPGKEVLKKYASLVFETADFMASYPLRDEENNRYILGPPLIPAQENHLPEETLNPLFELEYWRWGLKTTIAWKERIGEKVPPHWMDVLKHLADCPPDPANPGRYAAHENCADTYGRYGTDHPSMLMACGFLPPQTCDGQMMSRTIDAVLERWKRETMWGWDFPVLAMTMARLGRRKEAVDMLLMESPKNTWLPNGHNRQEGHDALPLYLPGNGGLLLAVAMMAAGWDGSEGEAPGFPDDGDGSWKVRSEGLARYI